MLRYFFNVLIATHFPNMLIFKFIANNGQYVYRTKV